MTSADAVFPDASSEWRVESVPLAHLSIELGHLYMEDFIAGPQHLRQKFQQIALWENTARQSRIGGPQNQARQARDGHQRRQARTRVSTCFLVDDYFTRFSSPAELVPELVGAANQAHLKIDYLVRESAYADAGSVPLARVVEDRLVSDPPPNTNGSRPPATEIGWLCNGQRSPGNSIVEAMDAVQQWAPPVQNAASRHSIFLDVELWDENNGRRTWSCAFLAAVWQLLRLGMLRYDGKNVVVAQKWTDPFPENWDELPAVTQLNPTAESFTAYRTLSILSSRFLPTEHAARTILSQIAVDRNAFDQVMARSRDEGLDLPLELVDRIDYIFTDIGTGQP